MKMVVTIDKSFHEMELHLGHPIQWNKVDKKCVNTLKDSLNTDDAIEVVARFHQSFTDQRWCNKSQVANQRGNGF